MPLIRAPHLGFLTVFLLLPTSIALAGGVGEGVAKHVQARPTNAVPVIDGVLNDAVWRTAVVDDKFTQHFPNDAQAPSFRTTVQVAYDEDFLYLGLEAFDTSPGGIVAPLTRRDSVLEADTLQLILGSRHDHDNGYLFQVNAAGVQVDAEVFDDVRTNYDWDAVWQSETKVHKTGWTAEFAIPLSILRFSEHTDEFGFNITRVIGRTGEIIQWTHIPRNTSGNISRAGHITGLRDMRPKRVMELRPFALIRHETSLPDGGSFVLDSEQSIGKIRIGLDAKIGLTDGLTLDATVNPDFGQVEADPVELNLTTFETFLPEKRPFFLEAAGLFQTDIPLIHSRRIGQRSTRFASGSTIVLADGPQTIARAPRAVPILAALRVSGSIGSNFSLNAVNALTAPEVVSLENNIDVELSPSRNFSAIRGKYSLGGSSYLGFVGTSTFRLGESIVPTANHDSLSQSVDGRWVRSDSMYRAYFQVATSQRLGGDTFREGDRNCTASTNCREITRADGGIQRPGDIGGGATMGFTKAGGEIRYRAQLTSVSPQFDIDDLGFLADFDVHELYADVSIHREKDFLWFQRGEWRLMSWATYAYDGTRKDLQWHLHSDAQFKNFWSLNFVMQQTPQGNFTMRETADGGRFEKSDRLRGILELTSDSRHDYTAGIGGTYAISPSTEAQTTTAFLNTALRPKPSLQLDLKTEVGVTNGDLRMVSCTDEQDSVCWLRSQQRDYLLALQDSRSVNLTARASWAISNALTLEGYGQLFAASGNFRGYRTLSTAGARPTLLRSEANRTLLREQSVNNPRDHFSFANLNTNIVLRWEMSRGTTLSAVYTRFQEHNRQRARLAFSGLSQGPAEEITLLKLTYFAAI